MDSVLVFVVYVQDRLDFVSRNKSMVGIGGMIGLIGGWGLGTRLIGGNTKKEDLLFMSLVGGTLLGLIAEYVIISNLPARKKELGVDDVDLRYMLTGT